MSSVINTSDSATLLTTISPAAPQVSKIMRISITTCTIFKFALQVFYFKFPNDYDAVTVEVRNTSKAVGCAYVSVQNNTVT
jgi:hypothetical protein